MVKYKTLYSTEMQMVIIDENNNLNVVDNYIQICVLPYIITDGVLSDIIISKYEDVFNNTTHNTLIQGNRNSSDDSNMIASNRILYENLNINIEEAEKWMYLGDIYNKNSLSPIKMYCVNISEIVDVIETEKIKKVDVNTAINSDDALLLTSYLRLFNLYVKQNNSM